MLGKTVTTLVMIWHSAVAASAEAASSTILDKCIRPHEETTRDQLISACETALETATLSLDDRATALLRLGSNYALSGRPEAALATLGRAILLRADFAEALAARGELYSDLGQFRKAILDLDKAILLKPDLLVAYNDRGNAYRKFGESNRAIADFDIAIRLAPSFPVPLNNRALAYIDLGKYERAVSDLDAAIRLAPSQPVFYNNRCWARTVWGRQLAAALNDCNMSLRLLHGDPHALQSRSTVYLRMHRYDDAIADCDAALSRSPGMVSALYVRGLARIAKGDLANGNADIAFARAFQPDIDERYRRVAR